MVTRWDVTRAVRKSNLPAAARLVVFVLADLADNDTAVIPYERTPSLTTLAEETGLGRSTVARELNRLDKDGWVGRKAPTKKAAWTKKARTQYRLMVPASFQMDPEQDQKTSPTAGLVPHGDQSLVPERDYSSPTAGLVLVPERDSTSPRAGHVVPLITPSKPSNPSSMARTPKTTTTRGTRIPADFKVTTDMVEWAREHAPDVDGRRETEKFIDYWRAAAGARGVKTDWSATWRNWMRRAQESTRPAQRAAVNGSSGYRPYQNPQDISAYHGDL